MSHDGLIVVTGAAGFIGSYLVGYLNDLGYTNVVVVDDFSNPAKSANLAGKHFVNKVHREDFFEWAKQHAAQLTNIFHLGARTDTTEMDYEVHRKWNLDYSIKVWQLCTKFSLPLVYASSAATYGNGDLGYSDDHSVVNHLVPLNPYGASKNDFDKWALLQTETPPFWAGLKFFNVFGPNEYHKGRMASVILHAFNQINTSGTVKLFKSHHPNYTDGGQIRDFIYVQDVVQVCTWLMENKPENGLYNTGTGTARTFNDLVAAIFASLKLPVQIEYIDTPLDIRDKYQYFTEADMTKLRAAGYDQPFAKLEDAVDEYVQRYLKTSTYY